MLQQFIKNKLRQSSLLRQKKSRSSSIVIYRKYRKGELPDVQISPKDILNPLEAIVKNDNTIARLLLINLQSYRYLIYRVIVRLLCVANTCPAIVTV